MENYEYRGYVCENDTAFFTKKLNLDDAIKFMHAMLNGGWQAGIISGQMSLEDTKALFKEVIEPDGGW